MVDLSERIYFVLATILIIAAIMEFIKYTKLSQQIQP